MKIILLEINLLGQIYLNKSVGEITGFWVGFIYVIGVFVIYGFRDKIKNLFASKSRNIK
jgi:hypothetical protein